MRKITINISARSGTDDNIYTFGTQNSDQVAPYQFISMTLNYSIQSSSVTSTLILSLNTSQNAKNVLRSGQPIVITDEGQTVFEGVIAPFYIMLPITNPGSGGVYAYLTLLPSIYQFTITPFIFDSRQADQVQQLTGASVDSILVGKVAQDINTSDLLSAMVNSMDYSKIFSKTIQSSDLGDKVFLMADIGEMRDSVLRRSIDVYNTIFYQEEDGTIIIRQLDASIKSPFNVDLANNVIVDPSNPTPNSIPISALLSYEYKDNAYTTVGVVSNYNMIAPEIAVAAKTDELILSYAPNPDFYPRIKQLQDSGWFTGVIGRTQINNNIVQDPALATVLAGFSTNPDQYMKNIVPNNITTSDFMTTYQALLTGKEMGQALTSYATFTGTISLDDPALKGTAVNIIGKAIEIQNCDLNAGIIASATRIYQENGGSKLTFSVVPLGSITGFYKS